MAIDEKTAQRLREALQAHKGLTERNMMGGTCFMLNGNMVGGADRPKGGEPRFMFRVGKENRDVVLKLPGAQQMEMGGRVMSGFFFVDAEQCTPARLKKWLKLATDFTLSLPPK